MLSFCSFFATAQPDSALHLFPAPIRDSISLINPFTSDLTHLRSIRGIAAEEPEDTVAEKAQSSALTKRLYNILFVTPSSLPSSGERAGQTESYFNSYRNMVIRSVRLKKLEPFGTSVNDTLQSTDKWSGKALNRAHMNTMNLIIRNNLLFGTGDRLDPITMAENERILRSLPSMEDARIVVARASVDSVDLIVITKDVFSFGFDMSVSELNAGTAEFYDRNFLGMGHEWENRLLWDGDKIYKTGYEGIYRINNLFGSFINTRIHYYNAYGRLNYGIIANRRFLTLYTRNAGGIQLKYLKDFMRADSLEQLQTVRHTYQDYWLGRSFILNPGDRSRLVIAARYSFNNVFDRPEISRSTFYKYHTKSLLLGSLTFSRENFFSGKLIYNYGRTEDISYGTLVELTGGWEINEFNTRGYTSVRASAGRYFPALGYLASSFAAGGFVREGMYEQGLLQATINYFTPLMYMGGLRVRNFVDLDYTVGIRRFDDEQISLSNDYGIRGLSSDSLKGTRRLACNLETAVFSPFMLYGFRFVFFGYADLGLVGSDASRIIPSDFYSGIGLGVRVRNENLVFKAFQVRLAFYPVIPPGASWAFINIGGDKVLEPVNFRPVQPDLIRYR